MRKISSLILLLTIFVTTGIAQTSFVTYSEPFEEGELTGSLLPLSDGQTANVFRSGGGIGVRIYNAEHKLTINKITSDCKPLHKDAILSIYRLIEGDGQIIWFVVDHLKRDNVVLYRIIISTSTGEVVQVDEIDRMERGQFRSYQDDFEIAQDVKTRNYAVLTFQGYNEDVEKRVSVKVFNSQSKLLQQASLGNINDARFLRLNWFGMVNDEPYLITDKINPRDKKGKSTLQLSVLKNSSSTFSTTTIDGPYSQSTSHSVVYNPKKELIVVLSSTWVRGKTISRFKGTSTINQYNFFVSYISPDSLKVIASASLKKSLADAYSRQHLGISEGFDGIELRPVVTFDGSTALIGNNEVRVEIATSNASYTDQLGYIRLNDIAVADTAVVVRIRELHPASTARREFWGGYEFISASSGNYFVFNDLPENFTKTQREKHHNLFTVSDASTALVNISSGKFERTHLFDAPENKDQGRIFYPYRTVWNEKTGTLITVMLRHDGRMKTEHIAWIKL